MPFRLVVLLAGAVVSVIIISCVCLPHLSYPDPGTPIVYEDARIYFPGTPMKPEVAKRMAQVLHDYDTALYRVRYFERGRNVSEAGTMDPKFLPLEVIDRVTAFATAHNLTVAAIQTGRGQCDLVGQTQTGGGTKLHHVQSAKGEEETPTPSSVNSPRMGAGTGLRVKDRELVERLKGILDKYNVR
jgi:hypothetical protein